MLSLSKLQNGLRSALKAGDGGAESSEVASKLSDAITNYAADAEILCLPGPILIPGTPPVPSSAMGTKQKLVSEMPGKAALTAAINAQFSSQDASMMTMANGIVAYVAATLTNFSSHPQKLPPPFGDMVIGATVMSIPPPLTSVAPAGLAGADVDQIANAMGQIIHTSFKASVFTGVCTAKDFGVGPVSGPLL